MYVKSRFPLFQAVLWSWPILMWSGLWATAITALHFFFGLEWLSLPGLPISILGTAVSFYLGFKGNAAYQRLWEARKIWGGIVNSSRTWGLYVTTFATDQRRESEDGDRLARVHRELIYRHIAWLGALRTQLRRHKSWEHTADWNNRYRKVIGTHDMSDERLRGRVEPYLDAKEVDRLMTRKNRATALVHHQGERLKELMQDRTIEDFRHMEMANLLQEFYTLQGKAERIKNFPLPRQYATANHWFVNTFIILLPFALVSAFHVDGLPEAYVWLAVPATMIMSWVFRFWDMVVDYTENPFEGLINDIPIDAMARTIEIDLRDMLGETDLPASIAPSELGVLM
ncbi:MAG: bestrophin family protein [Myxococcota bacterium]